MLLTFSIFIFSSCSNIPIFLSSLSASALNLCSSILSCFFCISISLSSCSTLPWTFAQLYLAPEACTPFPPWVALFESVRTLLILMRCCLLRIWTTSGITAPLKHCALLGLPFLCWWTFLCCWLQVQHYHPCLKHQNCWELQLWKWWTRRIMFGLSPITSTSS